MEKPFVNVMYSTRTIKMGGGVLNYSQQYSVHSGCELVLMCSVGKRLYKGGIKFGLLGGSNNLCRLG